MIISVITEPFVFKAQVMSTSNYLSLQVLLLLLAIVLSKKDNIFVTGGHKCYLLLFGGADLLLLFGGADLLRNSW